MNSIFTFDHGQKKLNKAIGIEEAYMDDLQEQIANLLKNHLFDENRELKDDVSPSMLVEAALSEFSYSQLVIIASFFLQDKLDGFAESLEKKVDGLKAIVNKIALNCEDLPPHIKEFLENMDGGNTKDDAIDSRNLPPEIKKFLDDMIRGKMREDDED
tara:strand:- start:903 stop:1376 length:474 start_codon:yes stop_codon:yes gene_type:complete